MTLESVIANLERTIVGKTELLDRMMSYSGNSTDTMREYVRVNISELSRILNDLKDIEP